MRIRDKIVLLPASLGVGVLVVAVIAMVLGASSARELRRIEKGRYPSIEMSRSLQSTLGQLQRRMQDAVAASDATLLASADTIATSFQDQLKAGRENPLLDKAELAALQSEFDEYVRVAKRSSAAMIAGTMDEGTQADLRSLRDRYRRLSDGLQARVERDRAAITAGFRAARAAQSTATTAVVVVLLALVTAATFLSLGIVRSITRPLSRTVEVLEALAKGDLTAKLDVSGKDEIAGMADSINRALASLRNTLLEAQRASNSVETAASELSEGASRIADGSNLQASSLEETASSMEQMTGSVQTSAEHAAQAAELARGSRETAEQGRTIVEEAVRAMAAVHDSSRRILDIITTIDEIAFQTNLLALNAAVEAARAGDSGRGFAVVAAEVRNLAKRSASAAREIKDLLDDSGRKVEAGTALVNQSGTALGEIVTSITHVADIVAEIAAATREQRDGITQVNSAIGQIDGVTQSSAEETRRVHETSTRLLEEATRLRQLVDGFQLGSDSTGGMARAA